MENAWSALADDTRRAILSMLRHRPHTAGEIADQFSLSPATVSHHLAVLRESGLVQWEHRAQTRIYFLVPAAVRACIKELSALLAAD